MKKSKLLYLLGFALQLSLTHAQDILWEKSYGGFHAEYLMDAIPTADYGFLLAGSSLSNKTGNKSDNNKGDLDYWVWKMNENGDLEWQKSFGGSESDLLQSIAITNDGGFILAGVSSSNKSLDKKEDSRGEDDFWVIKLNAKGGEEWQVTLGGNGQEKLHSIKSTRDGGYILGGSSSSDKSFNKSEKSFGNLDYWVIKLDNKGKVEWQKSFGGKYADELRSLDTTLDGGYILGGYSNSPASGNKTSDSLGEGDYWVLKLDIKGEIVWQKNIGGNGDDQLNVIHQTYDKGYILGGNSNSETSEYKTRSNGEGTDFWVVKLDETGAILWQETYNYGKFDVLTSLVENDDHTLLIGGFAKGEFSTSKLGGKTKARKGTDDYIALKIDEKGQELWSESVGSDGEDVLKKVIETRDGGYLFAGTGSPISVHNSDDSTSKLGNAFGNGNNAQLDQQVQNVNSAVKEQTDSATQQVNDTYNQGASKVKEAMGIKEDSPIKFASNPLSTNAGLKPSSAGNGMLGNNATQQQLPASRDKKKNLGSSDFWVVKLLDRNKPKEEKAIIEAFPNPATNYTNVVVGYDFESGTATLVDMAGRQLQQFEITSRTIPVDLSGLPEGIYVVNIKTNDGQSSGVKVMKKGTKN
ncbi:MAG: T9SS type A sorting domain-containing protein [Flavobacterium sp.]|nr:T9SS type A sorting domain-containing protein [Flavobacterium sp.]